MSEEEKNAIEDLKRETTDKDRREYMNKWFADDLDTILNLIDKQQQEIKTLKFRLDCKEQAHQYDVSMIDEVKGEAVKLYKEIDELKNKLQENEYQEWLIARNEN